MIKLPLLFFGKVAENMPFLSPFYSSVDHGSVHLWNEVCASYHLQKLFLLLSVSMCFSGIHGPANRLLLTNLTPADWPHYKHEI